MIQIHGKDYTEVPERVRQFHEKYPEGMIQTQVTYEDKYVRCTANVWPDYKANTSRFFTGHAEEDRTQGKINATNATENCETSAVGRALGFLNIGIVTSIASAEEVEHAIHKQEGAVTAPSALGSSEDWNLEKAGATLVSLKGETKAIKDWDASARSWMAEKHANPMVKSAAKYYNEHEVPFA